VSGSVYLVRGDDPALLSRAVQELVSQMVGDGDRTLLVEELVEADYRTDDGYSLAPLVDAAQTPPFLTDFRIVVGRELARFAKAADLGPLLGYLGAPLESTRLVLAWEKGPELQRLGAIPKPLQAAVAEVGEVVDVRVPRGRGAQAWLEEQVATSGLSLTRDAIRKLGDHLGDERGRVPALLDTLVSAFGTADSGSGATLSADDVLPYLGEAGDVAPWELTDAIAGGNVSLALKNLDRMQVGGDRHPLQILATLHGHYGRVLRLAGSGLADEKAAAAALGMKGSTFPAKKALQQARKLGGAKIARAVLLLSAADLDVRGASATAEHTTMEVLVARLAMLHR